MGQLMGGGREGGQRKERGGMKEGEEGTKGGGITATDGYT